MNTLVMPTSLFRNLLDQAHRSRARSASCALGICRTESDTAWLARDLGAGPPDPTGRVPPPGRALLVALVTGDPADVPALASPLSGDAAAVLSVGEGSMRGRLWGTVRTGRGMEPLRQLSLVGPGMHRIPLGGSESEGPSGTAITEALPAERRGSRAGPDAQGRWSRTIGAMGGEEVWRRLVGLRIAVVGCGRSGSLVAATISRLGLRHLTLIDPDVVEGHNLGEMDLLTMADLGRPKVEALAHRLGTTFSENDRELGADLGHGIRPLPNLVSRALGIEACKGADVVFSCVDNDAARLAAATIATMYHKILVDVGTGVHLAGGGETPGRAMGADVRLIVPGDGCLLCVGNLSRYQEAVDTLCNLRPLPALEVPWEQQRAGSSRALNQIAAHLGVQMLQDLVGERIQGSLWARLEFEDSGRMSVRYPPVPISAGSAPCTLCAKGGLGDEGLARADADD